VPEIVDERRGAQRNAPQQRTALRDGGAIRLGACPWDGQLRLVALGARDDIDRRGPWVYVTSLKSYGAQRRSSISASSASSRTMSAAG
jgi:hypothetical protein